MGGCASTSASAGASAKSQTPNATSLFENESMLPLIDGAFDEFRAKGAFIAAKDGASKTEKRARRGSVVSALYSTDGLSRALASLGFSFDEDLLQEAFDEFDADGRSLMMPDFLSLRVAAAHTGAHVAHPIRAPPEPASTRARTTSGLPAYAAIRSGVAPSFPAWFTLAPASNSSSRTSSRWPSRAAR